MITTIDEVRVLVKTIIQLFSDHAYCERQFYNYYYLSLLSHPALYAMLKKQTYAGQFTT